MENTNKPITPKAIRNPIVVTLTFSNRNPALNN